MHYSNTVLAGCFPVEILSWRIKKCPVEHGWHATLFFRRKTHYLPPDLIALHAKVNTGTLCCTFFEHSINGFIKTDSVISEISNFSVKPFNKFLELHPRPREPANTYLL